MNSHLSFFLGASLITHDCCGLWCTGRTTQSFCCYFTWKRSVEIERGRRSLIRKGFLPFQAAQHWLCPWNRIDSATCIFDAIFWQGNYGKEKTCEKRKKWEKDLRNRWVILLTAWQTLNPSHSSLKKRKNQERGQSFDSKLTFLSLFPPKRLYPGSERIISVC